MKKTYPIIMSKDGADIIVYVPDFNIDTQGKDYADAMEMARDAIGIVGIELEDRGKALPSPTDLEDIAKENAGDIVSLVDVDFTEYRKQNDVRTVRLE